MALPRREVSAIVIEVPSLSRRHRFKPFDRRCEKTLLMAKESADPTAWVEAVYRVVESCSLDPELAIGDLAGFDLEYLFVKLRAASISNIETMAYKDAEDGRLYEVDVDLDQVRVVFPDEAGDGIIKVSETERMRLKWPSAAAWVDPAVTKSESPEDALDALVAHCVDAVWVGDETFDASTSTREEVVEYLSSLDVSTWRQIRKWARSMPHLSYWVSWTNSKGTERRVELRTLTDFFTFVSQEGR